MTEREGAGVVQRKQSYRVSVRGIILEGDKVLLLRKPNRTWDLPGGKLENGESDLTCVIREVYEETGLTVTVSDYAGSWVRPRRDDFDVFNMAFVCRSPGRIDEVELSNEHIDYGFFRGKDITGLRMIRGCRETVLRALTGTAHGYQTRAVKKVPKKKAARIDAVVRA